MKALQIVKGAQVLPPELKLKIDSMLPSSNPVDHLANVLNTISSHAKLLKTHENLISMQRKSLELLIQTAENTILQEMNEEGLTEIGGNLVKYSLKLNPHKLIIEDESLIPELYKDKITTLEIRKDKIKDEMKMGAEIPGCKLIQDVSVQLKTNS